MYLQRNHPAHKTYVKYRPYSNIVAWLACANASGRLARL